MSIAVFDSGVGGISVLKSLVEVMPNEDFIYYGDSANAPYGTKTLEQVRALTCEHAKELILNQHAKGLVVACNTATSAAVRILREQYPDVPIVGIEPAVKPAMLFMENPRVLVMATPMTIREEKLKKLMDRYRHLGEIIPLPCPGLMNFVERGDLYGDDVRQYLEELLYSYSHNEIDAVVLGCTHYPFVRKMIQEVLGDRVRVFDHVFCSFSIISFVYYCKSNLSANTFTTRSISSSVRFVLHGTLIIHLLYSSAFSISYAISD